jgi:hypothetical protein
MTGPPYGSESLQELQVGTVTIIAAGGSRTFLFVFFHYCVYINNTGTPSSGLHTIEKITI